MQTNVPAVSNKRKGPEDDEIIDEFDQPMGDEEEPQWMDEPEESNGKKMKTDGEYEEEIGPSIDLSIGGNEAWKRPPLPLINTQTQNFAIQNLEADHLVGPQMNFTGPQNPAAQKQAIIRLFGATEQGNSVVIYVHNFMPYFYIQCWPGFTQQDLTVFGEALNVNISNYIKYITSRLLFY
jgi:hypothetical protein